MLDHLDPQIIGLILALGLGFLVGLEREWSSNKPVGLRSFALIGGAGGLAALLGNEWGAWVVAAGLLAITAVLVTHLHLHRRRVSDGAARRDPPGASGPAREAAGATAVEDHGTTTLVAAVLVYLIGAACVAGYQAHAVVMGGIVTILLHWKQPLHGLVDRIGQKEFSAVIRFVLITLVVLPVLPNQTFGPYDVLNPFQAWLLVVLIVALNLAGYIAFRLLNAHRGALVGGVLGGLVSSTATTVSFAGMTRKNEALAASAALIILIASAVVYARIGLELLAVAPGLLPHAAAPMATFAAVMLVTAAVIYPRVRTASVEMPAQGNPARLRMALSFAVLYIVIIFAVAAAKEHLGTDAIYGVAFVSGLTDVDAMTLSVAQLFDRGEVESDLAWRSIFLASLANLLFKIGAGCVLGSARLRVYLLAAGAVTLSSGSAILVLWP